jgi:hypothetical protein
MSTYTTVNNIPSSVTINGAGSGYTLNTGAGVAGSSGNYLISTGALSGTVSTGYINGTTTSSYNWANPNSNFTSSNHKSIMTIPHGEEKIVLEKAATLEVKGTVVINGIDLEERLKTIEKVLQIPERDVIMEAKYPKLADLYQQYMHELERYKTWDRIKGNEDGTT